MFHLLNRTITIGFKWLIMGLLTVGECGLESCLAEDKPSGSSLEDYLKQLGYEGVELERNDSVHLLAEAVLDGHKRKMLVDTGWPISSVNESTGRKLKTIGELGSPLQDSVLGTITNQNVAVIGKLGLGRAQFFNQPMRVEALRADYITLQFDGALGCDFLLRNFCLIDCWKRILYVRAKQPTQEQSKALEESLLLSQFTPIAFQSNLLFSLEAQINGTTVCLFADTGAPFDELDDSEIKPLGLTIVHYDRAATGSYIQRDVTSSVIGLGKIGKQNFRVAKLDTLQLGPRQWKNLYFAVTDLKAWGLAKPGTRAGSLKGFLCPTFLGNRGALIDAWGGKLWLRPEKPH